MHASPTTGAPAAPRRPASFELTLTHLSILVAVVALAAVMAVPRFLDSIERGRAHEAFGYLEEVAAAQERQRVAHGAYAADLADLDLDRPLPERFRVGALRLPAGHRSWRTGWTLALTREGGPEAMADYTVVYDQRGFVEAASTIPAAVTPLLLR